MLPGKPPEPLKLEELRRRYPVFSYNSCQLGHHGADIRVVFDFTIHAAGSDAPALRFKPSLLLRDVAPAWQAADLGCLQNLAFHIGLVEMLSYWKATCSPRIVIAAGGLSDDQMRWWHDLLLHGMGEFFYVNAIDFTREDFVTIRATGPAAAGVLDLDAGPERYLVPVGGGRDSALTAEALRQSGLAFRPLLLNPLPAALRVCEAAGCSAPILIDRTLDPLLLQMNRQGFLNGHTPFSACLAFISALSLVLYGGSTIVISNERSSNEASTGYLSFDINHQYSKSARFEASFDDYLRAFLVKDARYVSFVRSLYELQIARAFARLPQYFCAFRSCNRHQKLDSWCGECAKCLSVFITLYPFISQTDVLRIFGADLFQRPGTLPILKQLAGMHGAKPLDCVCTREETLAAVHLCRQKLAAQHLPTPPALLGFEPDLPDASAAADAILRDRGPDQLPAPLRSALERFLQDVSG